MKTRFYGEIKDGVYTRTHPEIFDAYCLGQPDGEYSEDFQKTVSPKTLAQLAYYYAVIIPTVLRQMKEDGNETYVVMIGGRAKEMPLGKDIVDNILKEACMVESKSRMSIDEASEFIERCIKWCARYLGCVIPPANKDWMR